MAETLQLNRLSQPVAVVSGFVFVGVLSGVFFGDSPSLTIVAGLLTIVTVHLLWRPGEPPALLLLATIHLLQVIAALVYANLLGVHINSLSEFGVDLESATLTALAGLSCLVIGMYVGNLGPAVWPPAVAQVEAKSWSPRSAFRFFTVTLGIGSIFNVISTMSEGIRQLFLAGAGIQWIGVFLLAYVCLAQKRGFTYLFVAVAIEIVLGFTGYFGEFRNVFFVLFVAFASARPKLNFRSVAAIGFTLAVALLFSAFWSAIKADYRTFINNGSKEQVVLVPLEDRFSYLFDRASEANADTLIRGVDGLVRRMSYVEFFGAALHFVPEARPFERGAMTRAAISHLLFPRLFFPDKEILPNDTTVTVAYTGLPLELQHGVSISIGYPGELYIDFGVLGMMAGMLIIGIFYGKANRFVQKHFSSALTSYGATVALLMPGVYFETSLPKTVGGVCTAFIILLLMSKFVMPVALNALAWKGQKTADSLRTPNFEN